jgi:signal transduction histidine kinase
LDSVSSAREKRITVEASRRGETVTIDIADTGPGIAKSVRDRLFQPFAGSTRPGGSGLGLAISRELLHAHGGDIVLLSTDSSGTRFRLIIPDRQAAPEFTG